MFDCFLHAKVRGNTFWYLDSGCSRHKSRDKKQFMSLTAYYGGNVTFGDNNKCFIVGIDKVDKSLSQVIADVYYVNGLQHNFIKHFPAM